MAIIEATDQKLRALIRFVSARSMPAASKIMGMILIVYAAWFLYNFFTTDTIGTRFTVFIGTLIIVICGTLILLDFSFNINRSIGLYAIAIGGNRFFKVVNYLTVDGSTEVFTAAIFIATLVVLCVSLNLCFSGYVFLKGETRGRMPMMFSSAFMIVITFATQIILAQINNARFVDVIYDHPEYTIMIAMYLILICMLSTETVRLSSRDEHYLSILDGIRRTGASSDRAYIYREQAEVLCNAFRDRSSWRKIDDGSPVEEEYRFVLQNRIDDRSYVTVQKWKDDDVLYFTLSDHNSGSLFNAYRFACTDIVSDTQSGPYDKVIIYGNDMQMQILVKERPKKKKWGYHDQ